MNNPNQNLHLERLANGFRYTAGSPGGEGHLSREFASLASFYEFWYKMPSAAPDLRDAIWQDNTDYPIFPNDVLYLPLDVPIELVIPPNREQLTVHGPHVIYRPRDISAPMPDVYRINATAEWLVVEHPACTFRGGVRGMLRPMYTALDRLRLKYETYRLRREEAPPLVRPGVTAVCGKPPADWHIIHQSLTPTPVTPSAG